DPGQPRNYENFALVGLGPSPREDSLLPMERQWCVCVGGLRRLYKRPSAIIGILWIVVGIAGANLALAVEKKIAEAIIVILFDRERCSTDLIFITLPPCDGSPPTEYWRLAGICHISNRRLLSSGVGA